MSSTVVCPVLQLRIYILFSLFCRKKYILERCAAKFSLILCPSKMIDFSASDESLYRANSNGATFKLVQRLVLEQMGSKDTKTEKCY